MSKYSWISAFFLSIWSLTGSYAYSFSSSLYGPGRKLMEPVSASGSQQEISLSPYVGDNTFDSSTLLVFTSFACALISIVGLIAMVRCALRCNPQMAHDSQEINTSNITASNTGMGKMALKALPTIIYSTHSQLPEVKAMDCPICLAEFKDGQKLRLLPKCNHRFHPQCIDPWLLSHSSCPSCRDSLLEGNDKLSRAIQNSETSELLEGLSNEMTVVICPPLESVKGRASEPGTHQHQLNQSTDCICEERSKETKVVVI
eukprot:Gb_14777 [translate_table: standard]